MSWAELQRWRRFEEEEPFPSDRSELATATVAATIANVNRARNAPAVDLLSFAPILHRMRERARIEEMRAKVMPEPEDEDDLILQRLVVAFGGTSG